MYLIAQPPGTKKPQLLKVIKQGGGRSVGVVPDSHMYDDGIRFEFSGQDVIIPLGESPPYGVCYNTLVEPVMKRFIIKGWGPVFWYTKKQEVEVERLHKALNITLSKMRKLGLDGWHPLLTEVRNPKGKINATYAYKPKGTDVLTIRPMQGQGLRELVKVISHEAWHGVWFRVMTAEDRAEWIEAYDAYTSISSVSIGDIKRMVQAMRQIESVKAFIKEAEFEEKIAAKKYFNWLQKIHSISPRDVQDLLTAGRRIPMPDTYLHRSSTAVPITLYSKESPSELFAEAGSSDIVGDLSDKHLKAMLHKLDR